MAKVGAPPQDATSGHREAVKFSSDVSAVVVVGGGGGPAKELRGEGG